MSAPASGFTTVTQSSTKHPPILTPGKITPAIAHVWENACLQYFKHNAIISDWYYNNSNTFDVMMWKDFLSTFHAHFLPKGWDSAVLTQLLCTHQKEDENFEDWILSIEKLNTTLRGTTSRLDDARLRAQISANICEDLRFACDDNDVKNIISFKDWKDKLSQLDTVRMCECTHILRITGASNRGKPPPLSTTTKGGISRRKGPKLPPLTDEELKLLRNNDGCFKCRKFFISEKEHG
ncbi:hypothetical protein SCP_1100370 [Sparassis crispa]|uniref:Retrotransposon gag domain-containing protein n=1 Tax=Sparassis crispa TaxID=139825 RepID=A0A401GYY0_9APHY|nr:hypothetical protein SCP_1100370 [Sparassis crispa]GBE87362.1 hypothetical protein SCP_1100370 [Sparassis crispa]